MARSAHPAGTFPLRDALAGLAAAVGQAAEWVLGLMLLAVVAINVVNASGRYLFSYRLVGADELMVYTVIYVVMGWAVLVALVPLLEALGTDGFIWVAAGGLLYTVGIVFYALDTRLKHAHGIWHLFVLAGSTAQYFAILFYVL